MRCLSFPLPVLLTLWVAVSCCAPNTRADDKAIKQSTVNGKYIYYDTERMLLRVSQGSITATFVVDKEAKLLVNGSPSAVKLADLPERSYLVLTVNDDKTTVLSINAVGPSEKWTIDAIDPVKRTVAVTSGKKKETFSVIENAKITYLKKQIIPLADIKPGTVVYLQMTLDKKSVMGINIRSAAKVPSGS